VYLGREEKGREEEMYFGREENEGVKGGRDVWVLYM
jgi:hypothetical protein